MPDCNSGIRIKFVADTGQVRGGGGVFREYGYGTSQNSSQMFPNERLTP